MSNFSKSYAHPFFPKVASLFCHTPLLQRMLVDFQRVHSVMSFFPKDHFWDALDAMLLALFASCFNSFIVSFTSLILFAFSCKSAFSFLIGRFSLVTASFSLVPIATRTCWSLRPFCFACLVRYWFAFAKQSSKSAQTALVRSLAFLAFLRQS